MTQTQIYPKTTPTAWSDDIITLVENTYNVKYVGVFCLKGNDKQWDNMPVDIFYQPNPITELGHSHYMGFYFRNGHSYVTNGASAIENVVFDAAVAKDGEIIYSSHRHGYVTSADGTAFIDGGRDYTRRGDCEMIQFVVVEDKFYKVV